MTECDYLVPQITPDGYENSYYTLGVKYEGEKSLGVSWQDFRKKYIELGGDGIYGAWAVPYLEPLVQERQFVYRNQEVYKDLFYEKGICPVAESVQPKLMQFKTNYRDLGLAEQKASSLLKTIKYFR